MKKAMKQSFMLTFVFLILFMNLFFLMRISLRDTQAKKLEGTTAELFAFTGSGRRGIHPGGTRLRTGFSQQHEGNQQDNRGQQFSSNTQDNSYSLIPV